MDDIVSVNRYPWESWCVEFSDLNGYGTPDDVRCTMNLRSALPRDNNAITVLYCTVLYDLSAFDIIYYLPLLNDDSL